jgi:hypothetical protein
MKYKTIRIRKIYNLLLMILAMIITSCDYIFPYFIVNNSQDTLYMLIDDNKANLDFSEIDYFDQRFEKILPNDSMEASLPINSRVWKSNQFLIIILQDTLTKYSTFENVVSLKKYKEFNYSKDTLNSIKKLVITDEMLH